jgi:hypothetical protein
MTLASSSSGSGVYGDAQGSWTAWAGDYIGDVQARGFYNSSDARLKLDVASLTAGIDDIKRLRPVTYKWKKDGASGAIQRGLIAQEVQKVLPTLVRSDGKTGMLSVNYVELVPVLIKAIQEQQTEIDALKQQRPMAASVLGIPMNGTAAGILLCGGLATLIVRRRLKRA